MSMNLEECLNRIAEAVEREMDRQVDKMIAEGGIIYHYAHVDYKHVKQRTIKYDLPSIRLVRSIEEDQIHRDLDLLVLREQMTEGEADFIKDRL